MTTEQIRALVLQSTVLTEEERSYWLKHLPQMDQSQLDRLEAILAAPVQVPFKKEIDTLFAFFEQAGKTLKGAKLAGRSKR